MHVLLVEPPSTRTCEYSISSRENLGLGYLAACIRANGHSAEEVSCPALSWTTDDMLSYSQQSRPDLVGVSLPFTDELEGTFEPLCALRAELGPDVPIVAGGHAATADAAKLFAAVPNLSAIVRGEGEITFLELLKCIERNTDFSNIDGMIFSAKGTGRHTADRPLIQQLDSLPFPSRDTLKAKRAQGKMPAEIYVTSSRGCPYRCSFCDIKTFYRNGKGLSWRGRSPHNIVEELQGLLEEFGRDCVYLFVDDQFIGPGVIGQERAKGLGIAMREAGLELSFEVTCRADTLRRDTLLCLKEAGLSGVYLGLDSGSQAALDRFQKDITVQRNIEAVALLRELDIAVDFGFIMFDPWTTIEDVRQNLEFLKWIADLGVPLHVSMFINKLKFYPNTSISRKMEREAGAAPYNAERCSERLAIRMDDLVRSISAESTGGYVNRAGLDKIESAFLSAMHA